MLIFIKKIIDSNKKRFDNFLKSSNLFLLIEVKLNSF